MDRARELREMGRPTARAGEGDSETTRVLCRGLYTRSWYVPRRSERGGSGGVPWAMPWGESAARWVIDHVLHGPVPPVPSYGFDLVPILAHSLRVRRIQWIRRTVLLTLTGLIVAWMPVGSAMWCLGLAVAWVLGPSGRHWVISALALPVVCAPAVHDRVDLAVVRDANVMLEVLATPLVLSAAAVLVYVVDHVVAGAAGAGLRRTEGRLPSSGPLARRRIAAIGARQHGERLPYDATGRFIGAGREARAAESIRLVLRSKVFGQPLPPLNEAELLRRMRAAPAQAAGRAGDTDGGGDGDRDGGSAEAEAEAAAVLPRLLVTTVQAVPAGLWPEPAGAAASPARGGGWDPGEALRPYLLMQSRSRGDQLVVSLFVQAALQDGELRLTVRPQLMAPLVPTPDRDGALIIGLRGAQALGGAVYRRLRKMHGGSPDGAGQAHPVSLRDHFSLPKIEDLQQRDEAERGLGALRAQLLRSTEAALGELGVLVEEVHAEARSVINNIQVHGDNRAPIQAMAVGGHVIDPRQNMQAGQADRAGQAVVHRGSQPMSPGPFFPRRRQQPEQQPPVGPDPTRGSEPAGGSGVTVGGANHGTVQNATGTVSHVHQTATVHSAAAVDIGTVLELLSAFRADIEAHSPDLPDAQTLRDHADLVDAAVPDPASNASALRIAIRSIPALVAGTAVQQTGEALASALSGLLS